MALPPVTSDPLPPPTPTLLPPSPPSQPLPSHDSRLGRLDPKGCPPLGRKSHPLYRTRGRRKRRLTGNASKSQWPVPHIKPWPATQRKGEGETAQETPGAIIWRQRGSDTAGTTGEADPRSRYLENPYGRPYDARGIEDKDDDVLRHCSELFPYRYHTVVYLRVCLWPEQFPIHSYHHHTIFCQYAKRCRQILFLSHSYVCVRIRYGPQLSHPHKVTVIMS